MTTADSFLRCDITARIKLAISPAQACTVCSHLVSQDIKYVSFAETARCLSLSASRDMNYSLESIRENTKLSVPMERCPHSLEVKLDLCDSCERI